MHVPGLAAAMVWCRRLLGWESVVSGAGLWPVVMWREFAVPVGTGPWTIACCKSARVWIACGSVACDVVDDMRTLTVVLCFAVVDVEFSALWTCPCLVAFFLVGEESLRDLTFSSFSHCE